MFYTNEHYIRLKHVQLHERIYQIFSDHRLNDSNSSLKNICSYVFTTSNKPTIYRVCLLLGGNNKKQPQRKTRHQTLAPWSMKTSFLWHRPKFHWGGVLFAKKKEKKESPRHEKPTFFVQEFGWVGFYQPPKWPTKIAGPEPWVLQAIWGCVFASGPGPEIGRLPSWKTEISPENWWLEDVNSEIKVVPFQFFGGYKYITCIRPFIPKVW